MTELQERREKKVGNINVHLTAKQELQVRRLAEAEGISASEYLGRITSDHLQVKLNKLSLLLEVFGGDGSLSSRSSSSS